nr:MAG TPA: hypothetical protein [Caudoviricetes sp.]
MRPRADDGNRRQKIPTVRCGGGGDKIYSIPIGKHSQKNIFSICCTHLCNNRDFFAIGRDV